MCSMSLSSWPSFTNEEADAVKAVLLSNKVNYWTGNEGRKFEKEFAKFAACNHAIAVANGTVAIELALYALGIGKGDEVIVTPRTFLASASAIVICGATPVFAEVNKDSQIITPKTIKHVITIRTKAIITVHLAGWPCEMDEIMELADRHGIKVIEDCAQAHGAKYKGRPVGSLGHVAAWSFCQDKIMSTGGEGGMVTTKDKHLWKEMWAYKDHGKSYDLVYSQEHAPGFRWLHESFGTNWRMTEMQATIGRIQLKRMSEWTEKRNNNASKLLACCEEYPWLFRVPRPPKYVQHAWYKCYVFIREKELDDWSRDRVIEEINKMGGRCTQGSCSEVYLERAFDRTGCRPKRRLSIARQLGETSIMFMVHPTLEPHEIDKMCSAVKKVALLVQNSLAHPDGCCV